MRSRSCALSGVWGATPKNDFGAAASAAVATASAASASKAATRRARPAPAHPRAARTKASQAGFGSTAARPQPCVTAPAADLVAERIVAPRVPEHAAQAKGAALGLVRGERARGHQRLAVDALDVGLVARPARGPADLGDPDADAAVAGPVEAATHGAKLSQRAGDVLRVGMNADRVERLLHTGDAIEAFEVEADRDDRSRLRLGQVLVGPPHAADDHLGARIGGTDLATRADQQRRVAASVGVRRVVLRRVLLVPDLPATNRHRRGAAAGGIGRTRFGRRGSRSSRLAGRRLGEELAPGAVALHGLACEGRERRPCRPGPRPHRHAGLDRRAVETVALGGPGCRAVDEGHGLDAVRDRPLDEEVAGAPVVGPGRGLDVRPLDREAGAVDATGGHCGEVAVGRDAAGGWDDAVENAGLGRCGLRIEGLSRDDGSQAGADRQPCSRSEREAPLARGGRCHQSELGSSATVVAWPTP